MADLSPPGGTAKPPPDDPTAGMTLATQLSSDSEESASNGAHTPEEWTSHFGITIHQMAMTNAAKRTKTTPKKLFEVVNETIKIFYDLQKNYHVLDREDVETEPDENGNTFTSEAELFEASPPTTHILLDGVVAFRFTLVGPCIFAVLKDRSRQFRDAIPTFVSVEPTMYESPIRGQVGILFNTPVRCDWHDLAAQYDVKLDSVKLDEEGIRLMKEAKDAVPFNGTVPFFSITKTSVAFRPAKDERRRVEILQIQSIPEHMIYLGHLCVAGGKKVFNNGIFHVVDHRERASDFIQACQKHERYVDPKEYKEILVSNVPRCAIDIPFGDQKRTLRDLLLNNVADIVTHHGSKKDTMIVGLGATEKAIGTGFLTTTFLARWKDLGKTFDISTYTPTIRGLAQIDAAYAKANLIKATRNSTAWTQHTGTEIVTGMAKTTEASDDWQTPGRNGKAKATAPPPATVTPATYKATVPPPTKIASTSLVLAPQRNETAPPEKPMTSSQKRRKQKKNKRMKENTEAVDTISEEETDPVLPPPPVDRSSPNDLNMVLARLTDVLTAMARSKADQPTQWQSIDTRCTELETTVKTLTDKAVSARTEAIQNGTRPPTSDWEKRLKALESRSSTPQIQPSASTERSEIMAIQSELASVKKDLETEQKANKELKRMVERMQSSVDGSEGTKSRLTKVEVSLNELKTRKPPPPPRLLPSDPELLKMRQTINAAQVAAEKAQTDMIKLVGSEKFFLPENLENFNMVGLRTNMIDMCEKVTYMARMSSAFETDLAKAWSRHALRYLIREELIRLKLTPALEEHVELATEEEWEKRGKAKLFPDDDDPDMEDVIEQAAQWEIEPFHTPQLADWLQLFDINTWEPSPVTTMLASMAPTRLLSKHVERDEGIDRAADIHIKAGLVPANILSSAALSVKLVKAASKYPGGKVRDVVDLRKSPKFDGIVLPPKHDSKRAVPSSTTPPSKEPEQSSGFTLDLTESTSDEEADKLESEDEDADEKREEQEPKRPPETAIATRQLPPRIPNRTRDLTALTQDSKKSKKALLSPTGSSRQLILQFPPKNALARQSIIRLVDPATQRVYGNQDSDDDSTRTAPSLTTIQLLYLSQTTEDIYDALRKVFDTIPMRHAATQRPIQAAMHDAVSPLLIASQPFPAEADDLISTTPCQVPDRAETQRIGEQA